MSNSAKQDFVENRTAPCCICEKNFLITEEKVVHHCHLTGTVLGVAHSACNLAVTVGSFLPVLFHNLSRYDAHHIVKYLCGRKTKFPLQKQEPRRRLFLFGFNFLLRPTSINVPLRKLF